MIWGQVNWLTAKAKVYLCQCRPLKLLIWWLIPMRTSTVKWMNRDKPCGNTRIIWESSPMVEQ